VSGTSSLLLIAGVITAPQTREPTVHGAETVRMTTGWEVRVGL
jgi:hypothetical protein